MADTDETTPADVLVFGSLNVDLVCRVASIARPGETVLAPRYEQLFGGKGANQAVAASRMIGGGNRVAMVGAVGDDVLGQAVADNLRGEGIDVGGLQTAPERTGCAFISIDAAGENAITVASGANGCVTAGALAPGRLGPQSILVLQMEIPLAECVAAARAARDAGARTVVNLAPVPPDLDEAGMLQLMELADVLVVNESELRAAATICAVESGNASERARTLSERLDLAVIATRGSRGLIIADRNRPVRSIPAMSVEIVDTTGAGDTFVGVFAVGLSEGRAPDDAAERAAIAASLACRKLGAQSAMPTAAEVERALAELKP
ncbi:MAG: ribokinase [Aurantimonas coralicida]|uniref:Ribokinase n=2 Tax=Hyphomicrobiales TaxID=356 RepID=A0A0P0YYW3_9HYPH|nr:ribokinase [Aurantimonas coralicida]ADI22751.1 sugar kinases, ribokinase family [uncultured Rhizobium sp. HF0500_29J11]BAT26751.1 sugar kinases, ribokinase family [Aurantimonas coralicida]